MVRFVENQSGERVKIELRAMGTRTEEPFVMMRIRTKGGTMEFVTPDLDSFVVEAESVIEKIKASRVPKPQAWSPS